MTETLPRSNSDERTTPRCPYCAQPFKTWQALGSHIHWRHNEGCPICEGGEGQACWSHFL